MFCNKCGNKLDDNATFCNKCGSKVEANAEANNNTKAENKPAENNTDTKNDKPKKKISKVKMILIVILVVIVVAAVKILTSPSFKIVHNLKSGDYAEAQTAYSENFEYGESSIILDMQLGDIIDDTLDKYKNYEMDYEKAYNVLNTIRFMSIEKFMDKADDALTEINYISLLLEGQKFCDEGDYAQAIKIYQSIDESSSLYSEAVDAINAAKESFKQNALTEIENYIKENDFEKSANIISSAKQFDMADLETSLMDKYIEGANAYVASLLESSKYEEAKKFISNISRIFPDEEKIKSMGDDIDETYETVVINKADEEIKNKNYEDALSLMEDAVATLPDNAQFKSKYNECKLYLPAYINDLDYFNKNGSIYDNYSNLSDNTGKSYKRIYKIGGWGADNYYAEYLINGNYTNFDGVAGVAYDERDTKDSKFFEVYGDGKLLYTSPTFTGSSLPKEFSVDITGVKNLRIYYPKTNSDNGIASIFDGRLYNKNSESADGNAAETTTAANN